MFKTAIIASTAVLASAANINGAFISGFKTGLMISNEDGFAQYECAEPESSAKVDNAMNMFKMAKNMMGMNKAQNEASELEEEDTSQDKFFETVDKYAEQLSIVASAMDADYEGGDFCAGLTVGFEGRDIIKGKAMSMAKNMFMQ